MSQIFQSFVPPLIIRQMGRDSSPIQRPRADRFPAAVLFADISNFTAMAESFVGAEESGAEELSILLNRFFDGLINIISEFGGGVTKFAGDALIALWPVPADTMRFGGEAERAMTDAVIQAISCACEVQKSFPQELVAGFEISVEIGIGAGDVYSVYLGGKLDRWEFLLSGSPLVQIGKAVGFANPGDVVISPQAWESARSSYIGRSNSEGFVRLDQVNLPAQPAVYFQPPVEAVSDSLIKPFIPAAMISRIASGLSAWLSEVRRISVMFILLPEYGASITHPFERTLPEAQEVMVALQESLYRFGGSINKLNVDDKGITLVAAFGLPPFSYADDAARAVQAALLMQSALTQLDRPSSIGIATGWIFCGLIGNAKRSEYTLIGNEVNLATRLMQAAEAKRLVSNAASQVICDEATYAEISNLALKGGLLAKQIAFGIKKEIHVKGKRDLVSTYHPQMRPWIDIVREPSIDQYDGTLVGRQNEMAKIRNLLNADGSKERDGRSRLILVEGEAGIGKTFFVGEITQYLQKQNMLVYRGAGRRLQSSIAYHSWKGIYQQLYGMETLDTIETRKRKVLTKLPYMAGERGYPALARELASLLNPVLSVSFPESSRTQSLSPETKERLRKDFLLRLLQIAAQPHARNEKAARLIIIEDAQWMDKTSWDFTLEVLNKVQSLLLLLTIRPLNTGETRRLPKAASIILEDDEAAWVRLRGLTVQEINELASQSIGVDDMSADLVHYLEEKTGGHPQFCKDLARNMLSQGLIEVSSSRADLAVIERSNDRELIPLEIHKSVIGNFDQLSAVQQVILKIASVDDKPFTSATIRKAYPLNLSESVLRRYLADLERLRILRLTNSGDEEAHYQFYNTIIREEIRSLLPVKQREEIYTIIAS